VTDTGAPQANIFITHLDQVEAFLRKDADTHMPPGSAANRALQIEAIGKTRDFLTGGFAPQEVTLGSSFSIREPISLIRHLENLPKHIASQSLVR
jgi:hypothetical protein